MDFSGAYRWWGYKKYIDPKEVKKMIQNMKKVPIIKEKSDKYHQKEKEAAERLLQKIQEHTK